MKNVPPDTYQFPVEIQKRFYRLINSKDDFLRNLPIAERRKLEILYEQLTSAWSANHTESLSNTLTRKYHALRSSQHELNTNCSAFRKRTDAEYKRQRAAAFSCLQKRRANVVHQSKGFEQEHVRFTETVASWKADILQKQQNWPLKKRRIEQDARMTLISLKQRLSNLVEEMAQYETDSQHLQQKQRTLTDNLTAFSEIQQQLDSEQQTYQASIVRLRSSWLKRIASKRKLSEQLIGGFKQRLKKATDDYALCLENDTKAIEETWLRQQREQMASDWSDCHPELLNYLKQGVLSEIHRRSSQLSGEYEQLMTALKRGLIKVGIDPDQYLREFDQHHPVRD